MITSKIFKMLTTLTLHVRYMSPFPYLVYSELHLSYLYFHTCTYTAWYHCAFVSITKRTWLWWNFGYEWKPLLNNDYNKIINDGCVYFTRSCSKYFSTAHSLKPSKKARVFCPHCNFLEPHNHKTSAHLTNKIFKAAPWSQRQTNVAYLAYIWKSLLFACLIILLTQYDIQLS